MVASPAMAHRLLYRTQAGVDCILWAQTSYSTNGQNANGHGWIAIGADGFRHGTDGLQWAPTTLREGADNLPCAGSSNRALSRTLRARIHLHKAPTLHRWVGMSK
jgi:hypothetical protein